MKKLYGNTKNIRAAHIRKLENLYKNRIPRDEIISRKTVEIITALSNEIKRQIGLLINRSGKIIAVIVGDHKGIMLPDTSDYKTPPGRLKGLRCIHTHIKGEKLTQDDLTDLTLLRLDLMAAITTSSSGAPFQIHISHIFPNQAAKLPYEILRPISIDDLNINCQELISSIETELSRINTLYEFGSGVERAILISVTTSPKIKAENSLKELQELAKSNNIYVVDKIIQHRKQIDPRFLLGRGKIEELTIISMQKGVTLIIFDQELNPSQIKSIADKIDFKVIDRTQLILDIFAQRAQTKEGRLQVEHAQLKYRLPRLVKKNTALSRLAGGIGGRGPGETKLEIDRRRIRSRISKIETALKTVKKQRKLQKRKREKKNLPVVSIIGYTNAGKSTLLNTLTKSNVVAESRLFATLDPSNRRMKFPKDTEVIITDTVGFVKVLPRELRVAFRATFEELESADLLLHVIDASNPDYLSHIESVNKILEDLNLHQIPCIKVLNKTDLITKKQIARISTDTKGIPICAKNNASLHPLILKLEHSIQTAVSDVCHVA